ncbi:hypothetical protein EON82_09425 [bacterium]|nr:MAG: hypothetical protein EON82_09425 [bacterium]
MGYTSRWVEREVLDQAQWEPLRSALADPIGNLFSQAGSAFAMGLGIAAIFAVIDWVAAGLGAACAGLRRTQSIA